MKLVVCAVVLALFAMPAEPAALPGFQAERVATVQGLPSSLAVNSAGTLFYTTIDGGIFRLTPTGPVEITRVTTTAVADAGLLGMALLDDHTAVVHYTTPSISHEVFAVVDLRDGSSTILTLINTHAEVPSFPVPPEHHGGKPVLGPNDDVFVGIGDFGWDFTAIGTVWNAGKVFRIDPDGGVTRFARGFRNPADIAWDERRNRLIVVDSVPSGGEEIHVVREGDDAGWPYTWGARPAFELSVDADYVFPAPVDAKGLLLLRNAQPHLRDGILVGGSRSQAIYYFPDLVVRPMPDPLVLLEGQTPPVIDFAQGPDGTIWFIAGTPAAGSALYRLIPPRRGDCNGDGRVDIADLSALTAELGDGPNQSTFAVHRGAHRGTWGCDADQDGFVNANDAVELIQMVTAVRRRAAGK